MSFHTQHHVNEKAGRTTHIFPNDHGPGDPVIGGALQNFLERLIRAGGAIPPGMNTGFVVPFDPEMFKIVAIELMDDHGVDMLFHSFASGIFQDNDKLGVVLETKSGPLVLTANKIVDCTGDGDIAGFRAGEDAVVAAEQPGDRVEMWSDGCGSYVRGASRGIIRPRRNEARAGHGAVLATRETLDIMRLRYGEDFATEHRRKTAPRWDAQWTGYCRSSP